MELVIEKQSMMSASECAKYTIPADIWARFKFEGCYPDAKGTIAKDGTVVAQLSMYNDNVIIKPSGTYDVCVLGRNTKSSIYVELVQEGGGGTSETVVVAPGENVTVTKNTVGDTTTYTVNATDKDSKTVVQAGENITVTSSTDGDTTTYVVSGQQGGTNVEVRGGTNTTVAATTEAGKTIYTVNATEQESHTVVKAGENVTVVEGTEGGKTTYTVSATGGGTPAEQKIYKVTSTNTDTLTVAESTSGNTTTFSLTATGGTADVELESTDPNLIIVKE